MGKIPWRREWQPTPVFLPGKSHGHRSLVGYSSRGHKESDTTEETACAHINSFSFSIGRPGLCACGLSPGAACRGCCVPGSSWWWCLSLRSTSARCKGFRSCGCRLSSSGEWAELPRSRWNLPAPAIDPVSLAMAGGFLTTGQPGKSLYLSIIYHLSNLF